MRVALIGGTGFVGSYLVEELIGAGHEPSLLVRPGSEGKVPRVEQCRIVEGDIGSTSALDATLDGCGAVIYNIGLIRENRKRGVTFETLQYNGVVYTVNAAIRAGISRMLLMSANGVIRGGTPYQDTKYRADKYALMSDRDVTIFRPSVIFGDPEGRMEIATQLYRDMVSSVLPAIGFYSGWTPSRGQVRLSPVFVGDVASAFVRTLENPATFGKTYVLGGPETLSWNDMIRRVSTAAGKPKWILPAPIGVIKMAAALFDWIPFFPVTRDQLTMLAEGNTADPADLESLIRRLPQPFSVDNLDYLSSAD